MDTNIPQHLAVVNETSRPATNPEKSHIFAQFLRRLNPLTYLRDQDSNSTGATMETPAERQKRMVGEGGSASLTNSTTN